MANVLGQLLVELGVNTAAFKSGMDKATYEAKQVAKDIKESFASVGEALGELGEVFGSVGGQIAQFGTGIANALAPLLESGGAAAGIAGLGAALAAAGVGAIGVAVHFSETAAKLHELSEATGLAVEDLSVLGSIAAAKGVDVETMAKAIEKMDKAALAASQSGPKASNAFKDLGIAVTDANGNLRDAKSIFDDVATKFAEMPDGPLKTAEAIKIFGRGGAALIPVLNEGGAKLAEMKAHFEALNAVIDGPTAEASTHLRENVGLMGAAFTGIENQLTKDLVPALNELATEFISAFEGSQDSIKAFADALAIAAKAILTVAQVAALMGKLVYDAIYTAISAIQELNNVAFATNELITAILKRGDISAAWDQLKNAGKSAWNAVAGGAKDAMADIAKSITDVGKMWDAALPTEKKTEGKAAASPLAHADTSFIDKEVAALERQANKEAELAKAIGLVSQATIEANAAAEAGAAISKIMEEAQAKGIQNTASFREELAKAVPEIQAAAKWMAVFKAAIETQKEFDNFNKKINEQIEALQDAGRASTEIEKQWAKNNATLVPLENSLGALTAEYEKLAATPGADPKKVQELADKVKVLNNEYNQQVENVKALNAAFQQSKASDEARKLETEFIKLQGALDSLRGGDAFLNITAQTKQWHDVLGLTDEQIQKLIPDLQKIRDLQIAQGALNAAKVSGFDPKEINTLNAEIDFLNKNWQSLGLSAEQYSLTLAKLQAQSADLQAKSGGFGAGFKAAFADLAAGAKSTGELIKDVTSTALKGFSDNFAAMVTDGKAKWGDLLKSMEQMLIKSAINNLLSNLFNNIGGILGGGSGGGIGSFFSGLFGGGHALGGNVTPGMTYLVGEKGPELFTPSQPGSISANGSGPGMGGQMINNYWNISTPDADSFRKSQGQIMAGAYSAQQVAARRNR